jgi:hypothetical protein
MERLDCQSQSLPADVETTLCCPASRCRRCPSLPREVQPYGVGTVTRSHDGALP